MKQIHGSRHWISSIHFISTVFHFTNSSISDTGDNFEFLQSIVKNTYAGCDLWILQSDYFGSTSSIENNFLKILEEQDYPVSLMKFQINTSNHTNNYVSRRFSQASCSLIFSFCESIHTCSNTLESQYPIISQKFRLEVQRYLIIFISSSEFDRDSNTSNVIHSVNETFASLRAHISLVQKSKPSTMKIVSPGFHIMTWSPNWIPGGSPILVNTWYQMVGFGFQNQFRLDISQFPPGATIRFCVPSFHLNPLFGINQVTSSLEGAQFQFFQDYSLRYNFTSKYQESKENEYGELNSNKIWTGPIGCVIRKEADIANGQLVFTHNRLKADVIMGTWDTVLHGVVVCSSPAPLPFFLSFINTLKVEIWICIVTTFTVVIFLFKFFEFVTLKYLRPQWIWNSNWYQPPKRKLEKIGWLYVLAPLCLEPIPEISIPKGKSFSVLLGFWFIFSYLITSFFLTQMIGILMSVPKEAKIASLLDLVTRNEDPWFLSLLADDIISNTTSNSERLLLEYKQNVPKNQYPNFHFDVEGYFHLSQREDMCLIAEEVRSKFYLPYLSKIRDDKGMEIARNYGLQNLHLAPQSILLGSSGSFLRSDADFLLTNSIEKFTRRYREGGLFYKHLRDFSKALPSYAEYEKHQIQPVQESQLDLVNLEFIFTAYLIFQGIATLVFFVELIIKPKN